MPNTQHPIVLLTDFGLEGPYVGQMKGVLAERAPGHPVIDLTHAVSPQDVREGAFLLEVSWRRFAPGSVFVAVVDPGVGTERAAVALAAEDRFFVGPDNGLLSGALPEESIKEYRAVRLENPLYRLPQWSATFHGRDLFAPAAAALASGVPLEELGSPMASLMQLPNRRPVTRPGSIEGRIVHIDRFGNLVSDISRDLWQDKVGVERDLTLRIDVGGQSLETLHRTYGESVPGELIALFGSLGHLEVAVNGGSAANLLGVSRGDPIIVHGAL